MKLREYQVSIEVADELVVITHVKVPGDAVDACIRGWERVIAAGFKPWYLYRVEELTKQPNLIY